MFFSINIMAESRGIVLLKSIGGGVMDGVMSNKLVKPIEETKYLSVENAAFVN
jgi:hypothetical protein